MSHGAWAGHESIAAPIPIFETAQYAGFRMLGTKCSIHEHRLIPFLHKLAPLSRSLALCDEEHSSVMRRAKEIDPAGGGGQNYCNFRVRVAIKSSELVQFALGAAAMPANLGPTMWLALSSDPGEVVTTASALAAQTIKMIGSRYAADRPIPVFQMFSFSVRFNVESRHDLALYNRTRSSAWFALFF
ncbi:hypothetical protein [Noviherbaspirillum soli]|uniref:hypothetical protein n=1 Tax=Noviherbaspirillum soli TaxID=1064518 RepID=UPI00188AC404|nr:hypothetical protein [Noviherbaspirillum soli]